MGGQACVLYGGAEFSRDVDFALLASPENFLTHRRKPSAAQVRFWALELRTPVLLGELVKRHPGVARRLAARRPLLALVGQAPDEALAAALKAEEDGERKADAMYWIPLRRDLEAMRHAVARRGGRGG
jgi:hypothetical protein